MLVLTVMVHMLMCAPMGFITPRPHFGSCVFPAEKWERDSNKVARKMSIVVRRSGDGFAVVPTRNWTSGNQAFTTSRRSCGSAASAPSLCLPLFRHAIVL